MDFLRLGLEVRLQLRFCLQPFARVGFRAGIHVVQHRIKVGQHKRIRVFRADEIAALFGQVGFMTFLVNGKQQFLFLAIQINLLLVLVQIQFGLVHQLEIFRVLQNFHQALGFRLAGFDPEQQQPDFAFQLAGVLDIRAVGGI